MKKSSLLKAHHGTTTSQDHVVTVEVCDGEDCFCSGGGAVMLELEDLVAEWEDHRNHDIENKEEVNQDSNATPTTYLVVAGKCRHFCSMGPNVYVDDQHYTEVQSIAACESIAKDIGLELPCPTHGSDNAGCGSSVVARMMHQRADRLQWQALREMARLKQKAKTTHRASGRASITRQQQLSCQKELEQAHEAALSATDKSKPAQEQRTLQRRERLQQKLQAIVSLSGEADAASAIPGSPIGSNDSGSCCCGDTYR